MKKILYIIDDINYPSGAQKATAAQIKLINDKYDIYIYSFETPDENAKELFQNIKFINISNSEPYRCLNRSLKDVILKKQYSFKEKALKINQAMHIIAKKHDEFTYKIFYPLLKNSFEDFDAIVVVSEASKLRGVVSNLKKPKKIQWIHTNYAHWRQCSAWAASVSANDSELYKKFDRIVLLNKKCKEDFLQIHPAFTNKAYVINNTINYNEVRQKAKNKPNIYINESIFNIITVGRLEKEKNWSWILDSASFLAEHGKKDFCWYIAGSGSMENFLIKEIAQRKLENKVILLGMLENPYSIMNACSLFVLLSSYEGTPVTIEEAKALNLPVLATDVGGIKEQLAGYAYGQTIKPEYNYCQAALLDKLTNYPIEWQNRQEYAVDYESESRKAISDFFDSL